MVAQVGPAQQALPLEHLIGGPLQALVKAHTLVAQSTLQFVADFGLEPAASPKIPAKVREFEFSMVQPVPDPNNPGSVVDTPTQVKIPLLAMVSPPNFAVSQATVHFNVRAVGFTELKKSEIPTELRTGAFPLSIRGVYSQIAPAADTSSAEPSTFTISMTITKEPLPEGTKRLLTLMQDAITSHPSKEAKLR